MLDWVASDEYDDKPKNDLVKTFQHTYHHFLDYIGLNIVLSLCHTLEIHLLYVKSILEFFHDISYESSLKTHIL